MLLHAHAGVGGHRLADENTAADDRAVADEGVSTQDAGIGVDGDVVAQGGVALDAGKLLALARGGGAQGDTLVDLGMAANDRGLADDNAGAVVDEEVLPYLRAGADVDARDAVSVLAQQARDQRHLQLLQLVCHAVGEDGEEAGVANEDLLEAARRRVAVEGGVDVLEQQLLHGGQSVQEVLGDLFGLGLHHRRALLCVLEEQGLVDLAAQDALDVQQALGDEGVRAHPRGALLVEVAGKEQAANVVEQLGANALAGEVLLVLGEEGGLGAIAVLDGLDPPVQAAGIHGAPLYGVTAFPELYTHNPLQIARNWRAHARRCCTRADGLRRGHRRGLTEQSPNAGTAGARTV